MTTAPLGSYNFGYHVIDFAERYTNLGAEASIIFEGPSLFRFDFIRMWFPAWFVTTDPTTGTCCVTKAPGSGPLPYPDLANRGSAGTIPNVYVLCSENPRMQLWPDTYSIVAADTTCTPYPLECYEEGIPPLEVITEGHPLYWGGASDQEECFAQITINFRRKAHADWPTSMYPCNFQGTGWEEHTEWKLPTIPPGTYIEVEQNPGITTRPLESDGVKYNVTEEWHRNLLPGDCVTATISGAPGFAPAFCNPSTVDIPDLKPEEREHITNDQVVFSEHLIIKWLGTPMANWQRIRDLRGRVNQSVWLGYPPEAVLFSRYEVEDVSNFGGVDLYNITFHFDIEEAPVDLGITPNPAFVDDHLRAGIWHGRVGIWNRVWSKEPMRTYIEDDPATVCLNWIPYHQAITSCCDAYPNPKIYKVGCFDLLFQIPTCP